MRARQSLAPSAAIRWGVCLALVLGWALSSRAATPPPMPCRCAGASGRDIPLYAWQQRSDWINIAAGAGAIGDGQHDDTDAIQRALDQIGPAPGDPKVVYFPPGKYRITRTLVLKERNGAMLIGHGRATTLVWAGAPDGRLLWSNGAARTSYIGLVFDGQKLAAVGIDHDSKTLYETRVRHESLEFRDFRVAGIRVGHDQKVASAEMMFYNLVFRRNGAGVKLLAWNDYNNIFDGCLFEDNGYGVFAEKGNVVIRNARFERSRESDVLLSTHSHSLRRVVSVDSNAFVRTTRGAAAVGLVKIQASRIDGWKDPAGAIATDLRGPLLVFDTLFTRPPKPHAAPIKLNNPPYMTQQAVLSNVRNGGDDAVLDPGLNSQVRTLPPGRRGRIPPLDSNFLRSQITLPATLIDVKKDCGARGDGKSNDTKAIQTCVDRAQAQDGQGGSDTYLYFPSGRYRTSGTIHINKARFQLGGTGWHSQIVRTGFAAGPVISIEDPQGLLIEHLGAGGPSGSTTFLQHGGAPGAIFYRGVYGYDADESQRQSIRFDTLPAGMLVQSDHLDGRVMIHDSAAAHILLGFVPSTKMVLDGAVRPSGFLGVLTRISALEDYSLEIKDNQSMVVSDWYNEQSAHLFKASGDGFPAGRLTLDFSRAEARQQRFAYLQDYRGTVAILGGAFGIPEDQFVPTLAITGTAPVAVALFANSFWNVAPSVTPPTTDGYMAGNSVTGLRGNPFETAPEILAGDGEAAAISALDDLRTLSDLDLRYNACLRW